MQVIDRLAEVYGNDNRTSLALGVGDNYPLRWRRNGYITEVYALAVEELRVIHDGQLITAYDVLLEAREARKNRVAKGDRELREAL